MRLVCSSRLRREKERKIEYHKRERFIRRFRARSPQRPIDGQYFLSLPPTTLHARIRILLAAITAPICEPAPRFPQRTSAIAETIVESRFAKKVFEVSNAFGERIFALGILMIDTCGKRVIFLEICGDKFI